MERFAAIEQQISQLSEAELAQFRQWFADFDAALWMPRSSARRSRRQTDAPAQRALEGAPREPDHALVKHHATRDFWVCYQGSAGAGACLGGPEFRVVEGGPAVPLSRSSRRSARCGRRAWDRTIGAGGAGRRRSGVVLDREPCRLRPADRVDRATTRAGSELSAAVQPGADRGMAGTDSAACGIAYPPPARAPRPPPASAPRRRPQRTHPSGCAPRRRRAWSTWCRSSSCSHRCGRAAPCTS